MQILKVHRNWEKDARLVRRKFVGASYPFEPINVGDRNYACDEKRIRYCKSGCCKVYPVLLGPLEIAIISHTENLPPSDFISIEEPTYTYFFKNDSSVSGIFSISKKDGSCVFLEEPDCSIHSTSLPLSCLSFPVSHTGKNLIMMRGCAGFKKGKPITREEYQQLELIAKTHAAISEVSYPVPDSVVQEKRYEEEGRRILDRFGIGLNSPVKEFDLDLFLDRMSEFTDMDEISNLVKISGCEVKKFLAEHYNLT